MSLTKGTSESMSAQSKKRNEIMVSFLTYDTYVFHFWKMISFFPTYQDSATSVILSTATRKVTGSSSVHASNTSAAGSVSSSRPRPNFHNVVRKFSQQSTPGTNNQCIFCAFSKNVLRGMYIALSIQRFNLVRREWLWHWSFLRLQRVALPSSC